MVLERDGRTLALVFNGEVYNFRELRAELETLGHGFRSSCDGEVVLEAWARWGVASVPRLRGMFAFAIVELDGAAPRVHLVRDRLGIKPLYYVSDGRGLAFASELNALVAGHAVPRLAAPSAVRDVLEFGSVRQPGTIYEGARCVPAGSSVEWREGRLGAATAWWDLEDEAAPLVASASGMDAQTRRARTLELMDDATRAHLVSDVPVGLFLSGGLDSSLLAALMRRAGQTRLATFTVGFQGPDAGLDESGHARAVARALGTEHAELTVSDAEVPDLFERVVAAIDQPSEDGTNTLLVSSLAARSVKVVTSGLGLDELLSGYSTHEALLGSRERGRAAVALSPLARRLHRVRPTRWSQELALIGVHEPAAQQQLLRQHVPSTIVHHALQVRPAPGSVELPRRSGEPLRDYLSLELRRYLRDTLLRDGDVMSMARGLELRPVFLDHPLVTWLHALPPGDKRQGGEGKRIVREIARELLPEDVVNRRKQGFGVPKPRWLAGPLRARVQDLLKGRTARALLRSWFLQHMRWTLAWGRPPWQLWTVAVLLAWLERNRVEVST